MHGTTVPWVATVARRGTRRTWTHPGEQAWRPLFVVRQPCGCWTDELAEGRMWEPCMAHEADGHLSAISEDSGGMAVARCLVGVCDWQESWAQEDWAVRAAVRHWEDTRHTT